MIIPDVKGRRSRFNAQDFIDLDIKHFCNAEVSVALDLDHFER